MTRLDMTNDSISSRRQPALPKTRVARDLVADWKRWTLIERIVAAAMVPGVLLTVLAMSTALASGGH
ncbi:MAG: hypothetical protein ACREFI_17805 [Stellaceae bacterium]